MVFTLICVFVCLFGYSYAEKVIIIGSGASGIATASRLLDNNITDFIILEAENRTGGRIHSFHFGNAVIDLGAQYVHGEGANIAYTLAKDYVVHTTEENSYAVYFSGEKKNGENLLNISRDIYENLTEDVYAKELSVGDLFLTRYNTSVLSEYRNDPEMLSYAKHLLKNTEGAILSLEGAFDWFNISAFSTFENYPGDKLLSWNGLGYKTILDILLKNFPNKTGHNINNKISFGKSVDRIILKENSIEVKCKDGSKYLGDHVVFTPSLGVLKHDHGEIFEPKLSPQKVKAIENLGFDGIMKILVEFTEDWWQEENFVFVWNDENRRDLHKDVLYGPKTDDDHWLSWFRYIGRAPNNPLVMIAWYSGPFVPEVEKLSEDQMKSAVLYVLRKHLGKDYNIMVPKRVIHSKWCTNPNFRGTYSYETVQLRKRNISLPYETLREPIRGENGTPRILFAGEATNPKRYSTVDGAIESGFREGDRLLKILK